MREVTYLSSLILFLPSFFNLAFAQDSTQIQPITMNAKVHRCYGGVTYDARESYDSEWWPCSGDNANFRNRENKCKEGYMPYQLVTWHYTNSADPARCYFKCVPLLTLKDNCKWEDAELEARSVS